MNTIDGQLLAAHAAGDTDALIDLYHAAAKHADTEEARGFYLTHAFIFALEAGDPRSVELRAVLIDMGRESPL